MALLPAELYVESDYLLDTDYVGGIADAQGIFTPYVEEFYIEAGYFDAGGIIVTLSADLTIAIQEASASISSSAAVAVTGTKIMQIDSSISSAGGQTVTADRIREGVASVTGAFSPTLTVSITRSDSSTVTAVFSFAAAAEVYKTTDSLLEYFADLSAQAARNRSTTASVSSAFAIGHEEGGGFANDVLPAVSYEGAADFVSTSNLSAEAENAQITSATLSSNTTASAAPIEYRTRAVTSPRPITMKIFNATGGDETQNPTTTTWQYSTTAKFNTRSLHLRGTNFTARPDYTFNQGTDDFSIEFWQYLSGGYTGTSLQDVWSLTYTDSNNNSGSILIRSKDGPVLNTDTLRFSFKEDDAGNSVSYDYNTAANLSGWHYFSIRKNQNRIVFTVDGTQVWNYTFVNGGIEVNNGTMRWFSRSYEPRYDGIHINLGSDTTNGYSQLATNTEYSLGIWDFENTLSGGGAPANLTFSGEGDLNSTTALSSAGTTLFEASADLTAFYSQLSAAGRVSDFFANADLTATQTASAIRTRAASGSVNSTVTVTVDAGIIKTADSNSSAAFAQTVDADRTRSTLAAFDSITSITVDAQITVEAEAQFNTAASMLTTADRFRLVDSDLTSNHTLTAAGDKIIDADADLTTTGTVIVTAGTIKQGISDFDAIATEVVAVAKIGQGLIAGDTTVAVSVTAEKTAVGTANLVASSTVLTTGNTTKTTSSDLSSVANQTIVAEITVAGSVAVTATGAANITGDRIRSTALAADAVSSALILPSKISPNAVPMNSAFGITVAETRVRPGAGSFNSTFDTFVATGKIVDPQIDMGSVASILSVNKILHPEVYVYTVPPETRIYTVPTETRVYTVQAETRTYTIEGA